MKKIVLILACSITIILALSACRENNVVIDESKIEINNTSDTPSMQEISDVSDTSYISDSVPDSDNAEELSQDTMETANIVMTTKDIVITATLDNSETTQEFLSTLPRTLTMNRYGDREYYGRIESISENGESIPDFENGDVTYYPAGPSFAIFFDGEDRSNQAGLIRMGKITSDLSVFDELGDSVELQIELE